MDMDFLTDPIFSDLDRSDFIGGIDNEALDFEHLEQFMQVAAAVGNIDEGNHNNNNNNSNNNSNENAIICDPKTESPRTSPANAADSNIPTIATVSARVSLTTTPISTPLSTVVGNGQATPHLPESPPDSGSEPPYSPMQDVHGLTLTSRDVYNGLPTVHQASALHELHMQSQFTPPHQHSQHHFPHNLQNHLNPVTEVENVHTNGIRIKHEAGLIMNPGSLVQQQMPNNPNNNSLNSHHNQNDTHIEIPTHQLMYSNAPTGPNNLMHYETMPSSLYPTINYHGAGSIGSGEQTPPCMLTSVGDVSRVQVIGSGQGLHTPITRTSVPSTPVHLSSTRKRKMSTQLDCADYANIKPDPGIAMSPVASLVSVMPLHPLATEAQKLSPTSPVSISMPTHGSDMNSPPAHSTSSLSPTPSTSNSNADNSLDGNGSNNAGANSNGENADSNSMTPCIRFTPFQPQNWHKLCDQGLQELAVVYYRVDADKGFNFSVSDDAFVCQKKNHFQITCHARLQGDAKFVKTPSGLEKIKSFHLHFYGVKLETPNQTIRVEQSQSDRSKKPFYPVPIDLQSHIVSKVTVGRLHFSETTNNNMRKKGRPNPEQRYFQLVVGLHVHTMSGNFPVVSQGSERIIVRASNPGQFESDVDLCWQRGLTQDSIFHAGRVGINTDRPDESLVVHGNLKISGHIVQPSDSRAKQEISELDTSVQLRNLQKIRIVRYRYEPQFAVHSGLRRGTDSDCEEIIDTGVIAQEVREVIPDAVQEAGSIILPNGNVIEKFLLVNKDRILMENIGAVKELCKVTGSLENRIEYLERLNNRLVQTKAVDQTRTQGGRASTIKCMRNGYEVCSNRTLQIIIFLLVIVMAACLAAVSTLYFVEHNKKQHNYKELERFEVLSNPHLFGHDTVLINQQEQHLMQLHHFLNASKTHNRWPNFLFATTTPRPPLGNNNKTVHELTYNDSEELYTAHGRNDELAVVMEKPVVSLQHLQPLKEPYKITTSAPLLRNNKTINSKHKSKWPLPQVVLRAAAIQSSIQITQPVKGHLESGANLNIAPSLATVHETEIEEPLNASETSSEKVADTIPLPQDFENNSIDIDAQHVSKKTAISKVSAARLAASLNDATNEATLVVESGDSDITLKLSDPVANPIASTSSSNSINNPDTTAPSNSAKLNSVEPIIYNVYKTVSPPTATVVITTNKVVVTDGVVSNYSLDAPTISNKSQGVLDATLDNSDGVDLQNLSSNNDSADNPIAALFGFDFEAGRDSALGRRSTSHGTNDWLTRKTLHVDIFGTPVQCTQSTFSEVSNCQSVCFEDSNQLPSLRQHSLSAQPSLEQQIHEEQIADPDELIVENTDTDITHHVINATKTAAGKSSHATQAIAKQFSVEQESDESLGTLEAIQERSLSDEQLDVSPKISGTKKNVPLTPTLSIEVQRPPTLDCWKISSFILSDNDRKSLSSEDFCPSTGKSLNLTYIIPLSKYFKEPNIELHFSSSTPLLWTICNNHEHVKRDGKYLVNTHDATHQHSANTLQQRQDTSTLFLNVPGRGYFVKDLALRATNDLEKENICQEQAHEANALLQYNFRILRDCD